MRAVWYERNGDASVLQVGEMPDPEPGPGEVRVRVVTSSVNPSDWKRRQGSDGADQLSRASFPTRTAAGIIDQVGEGVPPSRVSASGYGFTNRSSGGRLARPPITRFSRPSAPCHCRTTWISPWPPGWACRR